jgi:hypothetical protein
MSPDTQPLLLDINAAAQFVGVGSGVIRGWVTMGVSPIIKRILAMSDFTTGAIG